MSLSGKSELVISSSALALGGDYGLAFEGGRDEGGHRIVSLPVASASGRGDENQLASGESEKGSSDLRSSADRVSRMAFALGKLEAGEIVASQTQTHQFHRAEQRGNLWSRTLGRKSKPALPSRSRSTFQVAVEQSSLSGLGLDALLYYVPPFVRERCVSGMDMESLCEHRKVCVLFVVAQPEVIVVPFLPLCRERDLRGRCVACIICGASGQRLKSSFLATEVPRLLDRCENLAGSIRRKTEWQRWATLRSCKKCLAKLSTSPSAHMAELRARCDLAPLRSAMLGASFLRCLDPAIHPSFVDADARRLT